MFDGRYIRISHSSPSFSGQFCQLSIKTGPSMLKRPFSVNDRPFYGFLAVFFGSLLIAALLTEEGISHSEPSRASASQRENVHEKVRHLQTAQHIGDEADQYADNLLKHFRSGGICDSYSSSIRRIADSTSPVDSRVTKMVKIMSKAHEQHCVRY